jgi:hypothetical protein
MSNAWSSEVCYSRTKNPHVLHCTIQIESKGMQIQLLLERQSIFIYSIKVNIFIWKSFLSDVTINHTHCKTYSLHGGDFWEVMTCSLLNRYQGFGENVCLHLQDR